MVNSWPVWMPSTFLFFNFWFCFFCSRFAACGLLVCWPAIKPAPSVVKARSPNHWSIREFLQSTFLMGFPVHFLGYEGISSVQPLSCVCLFSTPWTVTCQVSLSGLNIYFIHPVYWWIYCFICKLDTFSYISVKLPFMYLHFFYWRFLLYWS